MTTEALLMHKVFNFVDNKNIDIVAELFKGKVTDIVLSHLLEKANHYKKTFNDNTKAWLAFIGDLDGNNSDILVRFILTGE